MKKNDIWIGMVTTLINYKCRFNDGMLVTVKEILPNNEYLVKDITDRPFVVHSRNLTDEPI